MNLKKFVQKFGTIALAVAITFSAVAPTAVSAAELDIIPVDYRVRLTEKYEKLKLMEQEAKKQEAEAKKAEKEAEESKDASEEEVDEDIDDVFVDDPEVEYAYSGKDFVYAKVVVNGKEYEVGRVEFGSFLKSLKEISMKEEFFSPTTVLSVERNGVDVSSGTYKELEKDTSTPWENWTPDQWEAYSAYAQDFNPDEWQKVLMEYYTLTEIFAYYMGWGYTVDESAVREISIAKEAGAKPVSSDEDGEDEEREDSYKKVEVYEDLDSTFERRTVYCVTSSEIPNLNELLEDRPLFDEEKSNIEDPNAYVDGKYYFEFGKYAGESITKEKSVEKSVAKEIVNYMRDNYATASLDKENIYKVCVRTKSGTKNTKKCYYIPKEACMNIFSKYFANTSQYNRDKDSYRNAFVEEVADDAKG